MHISTGYRYTMDNYWTMQMATDGFKAPYKQRALKGRIDENLRCTFIYILTVFDSVFIFIAFVRSMPTVWQLPDIGGKDRSK